MPRLRESGTETLEQAFEAYCDALKKFTKDAALYQHNIAHKDSDRATALLTQRARCKNQADRVESPADRIPWRDASRYHRA